MKVLKIGYRTFHKSENYASEELIVISINFWKGDWGMRASLWEIEVALCVLHKWPALLWSVVRPSGAAPV